MMDVPDVANRLPVLSISHARRTVIRWIPGFKHEAPKRNFVLLIAYLELFLFGVSLLQQLF